MAKKPEAPTGAITIISRAKPGFRRAGIEHPERAEYPAGTFSAEQMEQLRAEPQLEVIEAPAADTKPAA
jgi:hypothetical protein